MKARLCCTIGDGRFVLSEFELGETPFGAMRQALDAQERSNSGPMIPGEKTLYFSMTQETRHYLDWCALRDMDVKVGPVSDGAPQGAWFRDVPIRIEDQP